MSTDNLKTKADRLTAVLASLALHICRHGGNMGDPSPSHLWQAEQAVIRWRGRNARDRKLYPAKDDYERALDEAVTLQDEIRSLQTAARVAEAMAAEAAKPVRVPLEGRDDAVFVTARDETTGQRVRIRLPRSSVTVID